MMAGRLGRSIGSTIIRGSPDGATSYCNGALQLNVMKRFTTWGKGIDRVRLIGICAVLCSQGYFVHPLRASPETAPAAPTGELQGLAAGQEGRHDFDFEFGAWKTHLKRLVHPLSNSTDWVEYDGTSNVRKVWNGSANLLELDVDGPRGHIEALSLRLYNPQSHQWSLNFSNSSGGSVSGTPTIGEFKNGRGEFIEQETFDGRAILVRFVISDITPTSCHFEQSFSDDGGKTWEVNWIATDSRISAEFNKKR
jgi:hypothetical protein